MFRQHTKWRLGIKASRLSPPTDLTAEFRSWTMQHVHKSLIMFLKHITWNMLTHMFCHLELFHNTSFGPLVLHPAHYGSCAKRNILKNFSWSFPNTGMTFLSHLVQSLFSLGISLSSSFWAISSLVAVYPISVSSVAESCRLPKGGFSSLSFQKFKGFPLFKSLWLSVCE